jgi:iron complex outermembrane receptor protein
MFLRQTGLLMVLFLFAFSVKAESAIDEQHNVLTLDAVTVVAQRLLDADLQSTPSTTDSLSEQQLDAAGIRDTQDLQQKIPGLVFTSSSGVGEPYLRGVGGTVSATGDPGVGMFVDGVYQKRAVQSLRDFYDVERVEIFKGPHAVAFGHNIEGGAISVDSREPEPFLDAYADVLYGSYHQRELRGALNLPMPEADMAFRLAGTVKKRDGYSRNLYLDEEVDDRDYTSWRGKLRYRPASNLDIVVSAERTAQDDTQGMSRQPDPDIGVNGGILNGGTVPSDPREVMRNVDESQDIKGEIYSAKILWDVGDVEVRSITAYQKTDLNTVVDLDGTEVDFSSRDSATSADTVSQELRIASPQDQTFAWEAGVFYLHEDATQQLDARLPLLGISNIPVSKTANSSYAIFSGMSRAFTPQWRGRVGLRYSYDEIELDLEQTLIDEFGVMGPAGSYTFLFQEKNQWETLTPEASLTFSPNRETLYYAKVSRGYKAGGYNAYAIQPSYDPEYLTAYETGVKATLPGKHVHVNAALFYYDYTDKQIITLAPGAPQGTLPIVDNAARASIRGLDLQAGYKPGNLDLTLGATLMSARFDEFESVDPNNPTNDPDRSGDQLPQAPHVSLVLGSAYQWKPTYSGSLRLSLDYRYQSKVYFNPYHDPAVAQDAYSLLNAGIGYEHQKGTWYAELYGKNLTDELYAQNIVRLDPAMGTVRIWGEPRTFGIRLGYRW